MKNRIILLFGLLLMLAGLLWHAATFQESLEASWKVQDTMPKLREDFREANTSEILPDESPKPEEIMTEIVISGVSYIGILEIPVLSLELPVISVWSKENSKIAPCRYSGSVFQDDLILCAHNYDSHFGQLSELSMGDEVIFTDIDGNQHIYQAEGTQLLNGTDVTEIHNGDWDLTLFTCTPGGSKRYVLRCKKVL